MAGPRSAGGQKSGGRFRDGNEFIASYSLQNRGEPSRYGRLETILMLQVAGERQPREAPLRRCLTSMPFSSVT